MSLHGAFHWKSWLKKCSFVSVVIEGAAAVATVFLLLLRER